MKPATFLLVLGLGTYGAGLSGCVTDSVEALFSVSASPQSALVAANSFDALETMATGYLSLPACASGGSAACRNATAAAKIAPAVRSGRTARNQVEAMLQANNGGKIPVATIQTLQAAIATLQAVYAQYNIQH
jgi:hypothetical protein